MKRYRHDEKPFKIFGVPFFEETGRLERLPKELRTQLPDLDFLGQRVPGARLCFRTDAARFTVRIRYEKLSLDHGMSMIQGESGLVFIGDRPVSRYAGAVVPASYDVTESEATFEKSESMEDVTIYLPRNPILRGIEIEVEDDAKVEEATPYRGTHPILYYGPSITEGGCGMISNCYSSLISRWTDMDFYNMGFSGNAFGEPIMADYLNTIPCDILVYDYDQNSPNAEHLEGTHEPFFRMIREKQPKLPIVIVTCPFYKNEEERDIRGAIVRRTYDNARAAGDENVYFVDGAAAYGEENRQICTVDGIHPNDLGFYLIAKKMLPAIEEILRKNS